MKVMQSNGKEMKWMREKGTRSVGSELEQEIR